jgi:hypothetical protein
MPFRTDSALGPGGSVLSSASHAGRGSSLGRSGTSQSVQRSVPRPQSPDLGNNTASTGDPQSLTVSNTLANSQTVQGAGEGDASRSGKFSEEWDASQRGSSIIDGASPGMQRSNSFSGSRGNTLRKKASLRRSGSLKRSSSRRSMKAGSVKSLALQSNEEEDQIHSAFFCPVPTTGNPTETLSSRFQGSVNSILPPFPDLPK